MDVDCHAAQICPSGYDCDGRVVPRASRSAFFELANKMSLSPAEYMTVQKIYVGWSFLEFRLSLPFFSL